MGSPSKSQSPKTFMAAQGMLLDSDDDFKYEQVSLKGRFSVADENDLAATMKAAEDRARLNAARRNRAETAASGAQYLEATDDFIRNALLRLGLVATLDCFQNEWYEMVRRGLLEEENGDVVYNIYTENQHLHGALRSLHLETEAYKREASRLSDAVLTAQRARDHHKLQLTRALQEKERLLQDMRRLKAQCEAYEPALKRMEEKYQVVVRHLTLLSLERDKEKHPDALKQETGRKAERGGRGQAKGQPRASSTPFLL